MQTAVEELRPVVGTRAACRAVGVAPATFYRRRRPAAPRERKPRLAPERALSGEEREAVLEVLRSERFVDCSPAQVWATLLDEGRYLCSERTMYRLLAEQAEVRERRDQLRHPSYARPELLAERPNALWSWDITKLLGPQKWSYFYLYVILDVLRPLRGGLDGAGAGVGRGGGAADRAGPPAAGHRAGAADDPRGPGQRDDLQAGGLSAGRSRHHQDTLAALHLERQSVLGGAVQDAEVPAGLSRAFRLPPGGA
jgi:hypothetical protein